MLKTLVWLMKLMQCEPDELLDISTGQLPKGIKLQVIRLLTIQDSLHLQELPVFNRLGPLSINRNKLLVAMT